MAKPEAVNLSSSLKTLSLESTRVILEKAHICGCVVTSRLLAEGVGLCAVHSKPCKHVDSPYWVKCEKIARDMQVSRFLPSKALGIVDIRLLKLRSCTFDVFLHEQQLLHPSELVRVSRARKSTAEVID